MREMPYPIRRMPSLVRWVRSQVHDNKWHVKSNAGEAQFRDNKDDETAQIEKKTIYVNAKCLYVKLEFNDYYKSQYNQWGQCGLMGIKVSFLALRLA